MADKHPDGAPLFPPDVIRTTVEDAYHWASCHLKIRRKEKILANLRKAFFQQSVALQEARAHRDVTSATESISAIKPCKAKMPRAERAPNTLAWVRVSTNLKAPDSYQDKFFVPYLGESDRQQDFSNTLAEDADRSLAEKHAEEDNSEPENVTGVNPAETTSRSTLDRHSRASSGKKNQKGRHLNGTTTLLCPEALPKMSEIVWERATRRVALERALATLKVKDLNLISGIARDVFNAISATEISVCYKNMAYRRRVYSEMDEEAAVRRKQRGELVLGIKGTLVTRQAAALVGDSIPFFFCRQCYVYNCLEHGSQTARPAKEPSDRTRKDTATRQLATEIESACPGKAVGECNWESGVDESDAHWWRRIQRNSTLQLDVKSVVLELFASFGNDPCRISELARIFVRMNEPCNKITCRRVAYLIGTLDETIGEAESFRRPPRRQRKKSSKAYRTKAPLGETESMKGGQRVDYAPCQHDGPCTMKTCRCVENGVNCEKYCSCNHNRAYANRPERKLPCSNAFQGCQCKSAVACISNACVCYSYGRECDPDLCKACHDCKDGDQDRTCRNVGLRMGERQRTVVGRSDIHGWGAFAAEYIGKGEILGEYVGEIVSHSDADRRGRLYDHINYSFLFNITENWALDSTRLANKLRFCNHHFRPNCAAKLMRVGGDVRVGLYALRDIGKHEELFFDYQYKNGPAWSMPGATKKSNGRTHKQRSRESVKKRAHASITDSTDDDDDDDEYEVIPQRRQRIARKLQKIQLCSSLPDASRHDIQHGNERKQGEPRSSPKRAQVDDLTRSRKSQVSQEGQRTEQRSALQDLFGSDLESADGELQTFATAQSRGPSRGDAAGVSTPMANFVNEERVTGSRMQRSSGDLAPERRNTTQNGENAVRSNSVSKRKMKDMLPQVNDIFERKRRVQRYTAQSAVNDTGDGENVAEMARPNSLRNFTGSSLSSSIRKEVGSMWVVSKTRATNGAELGVRESAKEVSKDESDEIAEVNLISDGE